MIRLFQGMIRSFHGMIRLFQGTQHCFISRPRHKLHECKGIRNFIGIRLLLPAETNRYSVNKDYGTTAESYILHTINIYMLATLATTQRDTHKAVETGREVVGDGTVGAVEEARTEYLAHTYGIIAQYII